MSETGSLLADSAYEIINGADTDSQDGHLTESTSSLEVPRPDDIHSMDGSENNYDTDSDDGSDRSHASLRYADQALQSPSTAQLPSISRQYTPPPIDQTDVGLQSIEFQEAGEHGPTNLREISVMHAVREYNETETASLAEQMGLDTPPKRLVATVRQTMSPSYLSTKEPLRVLYIGNPEAQRSIVLKISSAIWASDARDSRGHVSRRPDDVYNIVPISSFGSMPEIDLMEASHYQIKVQHCTSAVKRPAEDGESPATYEIYLENGMLYNSVATREGYSVNPRWTLPNIAIFYCTDNDDAVDELNRSAAFAFAKRHNIPTIFVSNTQNFAKHHASRFGHFVGEHAVHMCLESRDPERPIAPQRYPIDLLSFSNIDSRQMNRHLAHLTGLTEAAEKPVVAESEKAEQTSSVHGPVNQKPCQTPSCGQILEVFERHRWLVAIVFPLLMALLAPLFMTGGTPPIQGVPSLRDAKPVRTCGTGIPQLLTTSTQSAPVTTTTVVINVTSTKTVQISQVQSSASGLASALSFAGLLSDKPAEAPVKDETRKTACSVKVHSPTEILVTLPQGSKSSWLAKDAISIDIHRGEEQIKSKLSSVDEGIIVELGEKDAYGPLNVSVVTTRKPKLNETFVVDFGKPVYVEAFEAGLNALQDMANAVSSTAGEAVHYCEDTSAAVLEHVKDSIPEELKALLDTTNDILARRKESAERARDDAQFKILQAQITLKLWWLKLQGKEEEWSAYMRNATQFLDFKHAERVKAARAAKEQEGSPSDKLCGPFFARRQCPREANNDKSQSTLLQRLKKLPLMGH